MATTLFVTETYLKETCQVYGNVDSVDILPHLLRAQDMKAQQLLGSALYEQLQAAAEADTLTSDQLNLIEKLRPFIAHYAVYYGYPTALVKWTNKGLVKKYGETSQTVNLQDMIFLRNESMNTAEFYGQRAIDFLRENKSLFPLWYDTNTYGLDSQKTSNYFSGIYTSKNKRIRPECQNGDCL